MKYGSRALSYLYKFYFFLEELKKNLNYLQLLSKYNVLKASGRAVHSGSATPCCRIDNLCLLVCFLAYPIYM